MKIYCRGKARIRHAETGVVYEIVGSELDWNAVDSDERQMGSETHFEAMIEHRELGTVTWGLWEYPEGVENYKNTDAGHHAVVKDFDYGLEHEMPDPNDWLHYEAPSNPYSIFMSSYHHTGDLLADHGSACGDFLLNRMIFSHQVTALEAYLGDTLINEVMSDADALRRLIVKADELSDAKFTLAEIASSPDLVQSNVRAYLRGIVYHNLAKVDALYNIAFEFRILTLINDKSSLFKAVSLRHDCVHRNGFDKDGKELEVFTKDFVQTVADQIRGFVGSIEKAVRGRQGAASEPCRAR